MNRNNNTVDVMFVHIPGTGGSNIRRALYEIPFEYKLDLIRNGIDNNIHPNYAELVQYFESIGVTPSFKFAIVRNPMTRIASLISRRIVKPDEFLDGTSKWAEPRYGQIEMLEGIPDDLQVYKYETDLKEIYSKIYQITGRIGPISKIHYPKTEPMNILIGPACMQKVIERYEPEFVRFGYEEELAAYKQKLGM